MCENNAKNSEEVYFKVISMYVLVNNNTDARCLWRGFFVIFSLGHVHSYPLQQAKETRYSLPFLCFSFVFYLASLLHLVCPCHGGCLAHVEHTQHPSFINSRCVVFTGHVLLFGYRFFFFLSCVALISFLFLDALDEENRFPYILIPLGPGVSWTCCQFVSCSRPILSSTFVLPLIYESRFLFSLFLSLAPLSKLSL